MFEYSNHVSLKQSILNHAISPGMTAACAAKVAGCAMRVAGSVALLARCAVKVTGHAAKLA